MQGFWPGWLLISFIAETFCIYEASTQSYSLSPSGLSIRFSFPLTCPPGHPQSVEGDLTSPYISPLLLGLREKRADCVLSQKVRDAASLALFFCPAHSNNEDNLVQKSNQGFWHELSCSDPWSLLSHHCQVGQIVIRARSSPVKLKASCLLHDAWSSCSSPTVTSTHLSEGLRVVLVLSSPTTLPLNGAFTVIGEFCSLSQYFFQSFNTLLLFSSLK